jgi:hypothetical protein
MFVSGGQRGVHKQIACDGARRVVRVEGDELAALAHVFAYSMLP